MLLIESAIDESTHPKYSRYPEADIEQSVFAPAQSTPLIVHSDTG